MVCVSQNGLCFSEWFVFLRTVCVSQNGLCFSEWFVTLLQILSTASMLLKEGFDLLDSQTTSKAENKLFFPIVHKHETRTALRYDLIKQIYAENQHLTCVQINS